MRLRDKFTGAEFDDIGKAVSYFCKRHSPVDCDEGYCDLAQEDDNKYPLCDRDYYWAHEEEVARIMGMEIINEEGDKNYE